MEPLETSLNAICPYFTMFPLDFPLRILRQRAKPGDRVLDPFCGRGTTNFAARLSGLESLGVDASPVAFAITSSKLVNATPEQVVAEARRILAEHEATVVPSGEFWQLAYHPTVLESLCRIRDALLQDCSAPPRIALRGVILGALHGPRQKTVASYFSNQCPRTYAPKPAYAVRFWRQRGLEPDPVDVLSIIERRATRYYRPLPKATGSARLADSRVADALQPPDGSRRFDWVITSPPYYGMRTYVPDQWLRNWFLGGPDVVDYSNKGQLGHGSPDGFSSDLRKVWRNTARVCTSDAKMAIRFGGISGRHAEPLEIIKESLRGSGWRITTIRAAGSAALGKRQADAFLRAASQPMAEYDVWAVKR